MIPTDRPCEPLHAAHRGEGMTGSHPWPAPHRETGTEDANDHLATQAESRTSNFDLPALNSMRPTAPPSRPYGRYAVGLRPSLDPDACFDAPSQDKEARRTNQTTQRLVLTGPAPSGMTCGKLNPGSPPCRVIRHRKFVGPRLLDRRLVWIERKLSAPTE